MLEEAILFLTEVMRAGHTEKETFGWDLKKKNGWDSDRQRLRRICARMCGDLDPECVFKETASNSTWPYPSIHMGIISVFPLFFLSNIV